jgi:hypothetical protein
LTKSIVTMQTLPLLTQNQMAILSAIHYFDIFNYPLKAEEIWRNSQFNDSLDTLILELQNLIKANYLKQIDDYYVLTIKNRDCITLRHKNEKGIEFIKPKVIQYSCFISKFPFVEAIGLSGSYSKGVYGEKDDIDYFIITKQNRLWLCRSLLRAYKKFFQKKTNKKYLCMNYFVENTNLEVPDKNIFVATEIKTLVPAYNHSIYLDFMKANEWSNTFLPNYTNQSSALIESKSVYWLKVLLEKVLNGKLGDYLENKLFVFMEKRRKRLFKQFNETEFDLNMRTTKQVEKHHPKGTQQMVLSNLKERLSQYNLK